MSFKLVLFVIFCVILEKSTALKYGHITECESTSETCSGCRYGKFICGESDRENRIFHYSSDAILCQNRGYYTTYFGKIDFVNCQFSEMQWNFFDIFNSLHTFNISGTDIETLKIFKFGKNLKNLIASNNRLKEIPSIVFVQANQLKSVDFSNNSIERVDPLAFVGANLIESLDLSQNLLTTLYSQVFKDCSNMKYLNLSNNRFNEFDARIVNTSALITFDISNNNLTHLDEHVFDQKIHLKSLNLSNNPIGDVNVNTFVYLVDLEHLNMRRTNISRIQLGTFSHQHKLITLDLSDNRLKQLDFKLFLPILRDLRSLRLGGNQLKDLHGFRNALFPRLELLDIVNNDFNCSYLEYFMAAIDWKTIYLHFAPNLVKPGGSNIHGISCNDTIYEPTNSEMKSEKLGYEHEYLEELLDDEFSKLNAKSNDGGDLFIKIVLVFILILLLAFLVLFLMVNREIICILFLKSRFGRQKNLNGSNTEQNETLLLE